MRKAVRLAALINNVDGISAILVKTVFELGLVASGAAGAGSLLLRLVCDALAGFRKRSEQQGV